MGEKKVVSRKVAVALGIVCIILAALLVGNTAHFASIVNDKNCIIASLNSQVADKDSQINSLNSQIATLQNQKSQIQTWLQGNITHYNSQITSLQNQISNLNADINALNGVIANKDSQIQTLTNQTSQLQVWLEGNKTLLNQTQTWLQGNVTYYESQIADLQDQISSLTTQISSLNAQITTLEGQIEALQAQYQEYVSSYQKLMEKVNQRWNEANVESFITPQDQTVRDIVYSITGGWSDTSDWDEFWDDVKAMYNWVVNNIEYRYDSLYPMLPDDPSGDLEFLEEMWQFPNETLRLGKGDCEDQAILLCSMIRCYADGEYSAEVIIILSSTSGHAAVQMPVKGYKLVIFDPAGKYYSHDFWGNIIFNDITAEINNWLNYWEPVMGSGVYVYRVFSDYIDKTFTSTDEYIAWMYSR